MNVSRRSTRVLLLRHAETAAPDRFHGCESDIGLSVRGLEQAVAVSSRLRELLPATVYSSNLLRARQTAAPIALACGLTLEIVPLLHERAMGSLSGHVKDAEGWALYNLTKDHWKRGDLEFTPEPLAESYAALRDRIAPVFDELARKHQGETIVIVAHGLVIKTFLTSSIEALSCIDFDSVPIEFTGINDLICDDEGWSLRNPAEENGGGSVF